MRDAVRPRCPVWRLSLRMLLLAPAAFAIVFAATLSNQPEPEPTVSEREALWTRQRIAAWPDSGTARARDEPVLKVAWVVSHESGQSRHSWLIFPSGDMEDNWHYGFDAGAGQWPKQVPADVLAQLDARLSHLPPDDPHAKLNHQLMIAYPVAGKWVVRHYPLGAVPVEVQSLATFLSRSKFAG